MPASDHSNHTTHHDTTCHDNTHTLRMNLRSNLSARSARYVPPVVVGAMLAVLAPAVWTGSIPQPAWQIVLVTAALVATTVSWLVNRNPIGYSVVLLATAVHGASTDLARSYTFDPAVPWSDIIGDLVVAIAVASVIAYSTARWLGRPTARDLVEAIVVLLGTTIATWVVVTEPMRDRGMSLSRAALLSAAVPLSVLVASFIINLVHHGLVRHRSLQLASGAALVYVAGVVTSRLQFVGFGESYGPTLPTLLYSIAMALMLAALTLENLQRRLQSTGSTPPDNGVRLVLMGTAVLVAVTSMAVVAPSGPIDVVIRSVGTIALIVLVVVRLAIALHEHEQARISLQARMYLDDLTGLPTRTRIVEHLNEILDSNWRSETRPSVIHLNLDRFKNINDTLGHHGANRVLVEVATRLQQVAASFGGYTARLGGDDFAIVDATTRSIEDAVERAESVQTALAAAIEVDDSTVFVTASMGVAVTPTKRTLGADELLGQADIANHRAKLDGGSRVAVFDDSMQASVTHRMDVEHALHGAIGRQEMKLYHQPIVDLTTGRVNGFESLMRWQRADGTVVPPASFIPIAEDTGMICELGIWALHDALHELRRWISDGVVEPTTTISVNVSPRQIADPNFADEVRQALASTGVPPHLLWLEMTESMMLDEPDLAESTLREVRSMGVRLALDDFGTGFSSLSLLQKFPIQRIKIDRAFVQGIADNTNDRSLVRTIIAMAHSMGLDLVAEGVETVHQLHGLRELGCGKAQGFLISHPVPAAAMRSTMAALDELTSLPLFSAPRPDDEVVTPETPLERRALAVTGGYGLGSRRPLGQQVI